MREPVLSSSWLNDTSRFFVAVTMRTGTCTSPKLIAPVQIKLGTSAPLVPRWRSVRSELYVPPPAHRVAMPPTVQVEVEGRRLALSNLDKVLYPESGFTKADVIGYYRDIAPVLLPHLRGRVPTLVRAPNGPDGQIFFEKRCPPGHPEWVRTAAIGGSDGGRYPSFIGCLVDDLPTLVWTANLAALELHTHQARAADQLHPTAVVVDLDPGAPATIFDCCRVALEMRALLDALELEAVVKTSGSKGLHLSIPLNNGTVSSEETSKF